MSPFSDANRKYGTIFLVASSVVIWGILLFLFRAYGYEETWKLWRVPVQRPEFSDFRLIPGSAESFRRGLEPTQRNPGDPHKRIFNYPAFWRLFFYTGITEADTIWAVTLMLIFFFLGIFIFPQDITVIDSLLMLLVIFSPASMLLYERGNVDLIVFFLCALVVWSLEFSVIVSAGVLIFAILVKIFPFFGFTVFLKEPKPKFFRVSISSLIVLLLYLYSTSRSVKASWNLTMRGDELSYGASVLFLRYGEFFSSILNVARTDPILRFGPILLAAILIVLSALIGLRSSVPLTSSSARNLAAFRMGASIYAGTFLLGNNWDYRLAFLIFVIPQLLQWTRRSYPKHDRLIATAVLIMILVCCWHFMVWFARGLAGIQELLFILDEAINWLLVGGFSYLLLASTPVWLRNLVPFLSPGEKSIRAME